MDAKELGKRYVHPMSAEDDRDACGGSYGDTGITLRQHFAGLAMQGALGGAPGSHLMPAQLAADSVAYADALLAELSKDTP